MAGALSLNVKEVSTGQVLEIFTDQVAERSRAARGVGEFCRLLFRDRNQLLDARYGRVRVCTDGTDARSETAAKLREMHRNLFPSTVTL